MPSFGNVINLVENNGQGAGTMTSNGVGLLSGSSTITEFGNSIIRRERIAFSGSVSMAFDAGTSLTMGTTTLYNFPRGNIMILGGAGTLTASTITTGIAATGSLSFGIGTALAAAADSSLATTKQNILPATAAVLANGTKSVSLKSTVAPTVVDGTTSGTAKNAYLNVITTHASSASAASTLVLTGFVDLAWIVMGDV